jgi:hypothetical protein
MAGQMASQMIVKWPSDGRQKKNSLLKNVPAPFSSMAAALYRDVWCVVWPMHV